MFGHVELDILIKYYDAYHSLFLVIYNHSWLEYNKRSDGFDKSFTTKEYNECVTKLYHVWLGLLSCAKRWMVLYSRKC